MKKILSKYNVIITGLIFGILFIVIKFIFFSLYKFTVEIHELLIRIASFSTIFALIVIIQYYYRQQNKFAEIYRLITENANDTISVINEKFEIEFSNYNDQQKRLGYSQTDLIGKSILEFIHPQDLDRVVKLLKKSFKVGKGEAEIRVKNKSGDYYWFEVKGNKFLDKDGKKN